MNRFFGMIFSTAAVFGFSNIQLTAQTATATFEISAKMQGGCQLMGACAFYTLSPNGTITYTLPGSFGGEPKQKTGVLSTQDYIALIQPLTADRLQSLESSVFTGVCPSYNDGADYIFEITRDGQKTQLKTCGNALTDDPQIDTLISFFGLFTVS
ncbi:hypothetical protein [Falsihalocynthiibacter arcticus]|uniref:Uncharacterized protein n=1 Tax=Falsihalocynthiibacter arcticus TaxID=1579316 RepID=A0A126V4Y9_9RHOB|nr:hypothetical protein [Falsihalocynthiibacter arcticus]AML53372.1 hypothetical protein RC74_20825 [Falsihalocynthiibacter arcticus]